MLEELGWDRDREFRAAARRGLHPGIVVQDNKISYSVLTAAGEEREAVVTGKLWHAAECDADLPAVGDWIAVEIPSDPEEPAVIHERLPRATKFSRKIPGKSSEEQVVAANVHWVGLVTDVRADFNERRIERYLALVARSGARAVIVVNKADVLSPAELGEVVGRLRAVHRGIPVLPVSAVSGEGMEALRECLGSGTIATLVGSSGVGKSTLVNALLGVRRQEIGGVNSLTGKGRHTTTYRRLVLLPGGGGLIDNPGMREVQMWVDEASLRESFRDVEALAAECLFADCKHRSDRDCRIRRALEAGELTRERYENYLNLEAEIERLKRRRKKRRMRMVRNAKLRRRVQHRNFADRVDYENWVAGRFDPES